jgi:hypothetical protein
MKLIIVQRSKTATFRRLAAQFAEDPNVEVMLERRANGDRSSSSHSRSERRRLKKPFEERDYIVVHLADHKSKMW